MERYEVLEKIGSGGFSDVYKVKDSHIGTVFAAKQICNSEVAQTEMKWLRMLKHHGIPKLHDMVKNEQNSMLIMEYMEGETLKEYVQKHGRTDEKQCREWMIKLTELLVYLHTQNIPVIHGDLKPENVILSANGQLALLDLGSAAYLGTSDLPLYGTKGYTAPERYEGRIVAQNDIYSVGRIMQYLLTGCEPDFLNAYSTQEIMSYFNVPLNIAEVVICATRPEVSMRYATSEHLLQALAKKEEECYQKTPRYTKFWFVLSACFWLVGVIFLMGQAYEAGWLLTVSGASLLAVGMLIRREEMNENIKILNCDYSIVLSS